MKMSKQEPSWVVTLVKKKKFKKNLMQALSNLINTEIQQALTIV